MRLPATCQVSVADRKSTRLNSSHTEIYTLSLHDALPILIIPIGVDCRAGIVRRFKAIVRLHDEIARHLPGERRRSEEHTSELQSHRDLHSFPTRRSSDLNHSDRRRLPCGDSASLQSDSTAAR